MKNVVDGQVGGAKMGREPSRTVLFKIHKDNIKIGVYRKLPNPMVYLLGGGFCSRCRIVYNFMELYNILIENRKRGKKRNLTRCVYCNQSVRTTRVHAKKGEKGKFWEWVDYFDKKNRDTGR